MGFGDSMYGMNWFLLVLILGGIYELYAVVWKGRSDRKLIEKLKDAADRRNDNPDTILEKIVREYTDKPYNKT